MPEGERPDCPEQASSPHAIDPAQTSEAEAEAADTASPHAIKTAETESAQNGSGADAKPAKRIKSKTARSRRLPFFLRKVDLFPSHRQ